MGDPSVFPPPVLGKTTLIRRRVVASGIQEHAVYIVRRINRLHCTQVEAAVLEPIGDAPKFNLAVIQDTMGSFTIKRKGHLLGCSGAPQYVQFRLLSVPASSNWIRHFVRRHGLRSVRLHLRVGSVGDGAKSWGMDEVTRRCSKSELCNVFHLDEGGLLLGYCRPCGTGRDLHVPSELQQQASTYSWAWELSQPPN